VAREALLVHDPLLLPSSVFPPNHSGTFRSPCISSHFPGVLHASSPTVTEAVLKALILCENLHSFTWVDDTASPVVFLSFLNVLRTLPLRALTLRTYSDLGEDAWAVLNTFSDLQKVAIWCMDGPPRVLQCWAPQLGSTLTELELGVRTNLSDHGWPTRQRDIYCHRGAPASLRPF